MTLTITTEEQRELEQSRKNICNLVEDFGISYMEISKDMDVIWKIANRKK